MKLEKLLEAEGELLRQNKSIMTKLAHQLASAALTEFGPVKAKEHAEMAANRIHSVILKNIDDFLRQQQTKDIN